MKNESVNITLGPYLDVVKNLAKAAGKEIKETADKKLHDATIQKAKIEEALKEIDFQILVVIDEWKAEYEARQ